MANNYYDATGVLVLDRVTPVISALFGRFRLEGSHPGNGRAYIARLSEAHVPEWDGVLLDLITLAAQLDLPAPESDDAQDDSDDVSIQVILDLLASRFGAQEDTDLLNLIEHHGFKGEADLEALFLLATAFDDGHRLVAIEFEGSWSCSKPLLFEFGGAASFLSREVRVFRGSSTAIPLGQALRKAVVDHDPETAAALIDKETQGLFAGIQDDHFRMGVRQRVAERLARAPAART